MSSNYLSIIQSLGLPKPDPRMVMVYNAPPNPTVTKSPNDVKSTPDSFTKNVATPVPAKPPAPKISPETRKDMQKKLRNGEAVDMYVVLKGLSQSKMKNADLVESMEMKTYRLDPDTILIHNRMVPRNIGSDNTQK